MNVDSEITRIPAHHAWTRGSFVFTHEIWTKMPPNPPLTGQGARLLRLAVVVPAGKRFEKPFTKQKLTKCISDNNLRRD